MIDVDHVRADVADRGQAEPDVVADRGEVGPADSLTSGGSTLMPIRRHSVR